MRRDYDVFSDIFSRPSIKQLPLLNIGDQVKMIAIGAHANMDFNNSRIVIREVLDPGHNYRIEVLDGRMKGNITNWELRPDGDGWSFEMLLTDWDK
jgi:hypothetical protein